ncbi:hydrogenase maturation protease [Streptomyces minutiscleroticus]|nr:hydrogenase maturation protease [Streptomyces minutiscleroticus]
MARAQRIVVIGVGNEFRHDDGVGWAVVARLEERMAGRSLPWETVPAMCDGDPVRLMELWKGADLAVVVDAARTRPPSPGRVHRLALDDVLPQWPAATSSHGLELGDAVELSGVLGRLPHRLVVYAVEGADSTVGRGLSDAVAARVESLVREVEADIAHCVADIGRAHRKDVP